MKKEIVRIPPTLVRSTRLARYAITNDIGENLGHCETFLVDLCSWRVPFIIASFPAILPPDKWYAIPYELTSFRTEKREFVLHVPKDVIKKAPGVDRNIWGPRKIDLRWLSEACRYYGCVPYWEM